MNHPKHEEWVPYLFGEAKPEVRRQLKAHLRDCADCRNEIDSWQRSLGRLNAWKLPSAPKAVLTFAPILNWAAAAALVLLVGFSAGRLTAAKADVAKVRATLAPELRRELSQEFARFVHDELERSASATLTAADQQTDQAVTLLAKALQRQRSEDNRAVSDALNKLESQSFAQFVSLKKDLDTVAVNADDRLRVAAQGLVELAGNSRPADHQ